MANAPEKPYTLEPGAEWSTTEPPYERGITQILYYVDRVVYTSGEGSEKFSYSDVSQAASFEAAKAAFAEAQQAIAKVDNLDIGGRNLLLDTDAKSLTQVVKTTRIDNTDRSLTSTKYKKNPTTQNHLNYVDFETATYKEVAPVLCTHGVRFYSAEDDWNGSSGNPNFRYRFYSVSQESGKGLKVQPGKQYTISCYIKATNIDVPTTGNNSLGSSTLGELVLGQDVVGGNTYQGELKMSFSMYNRLDVVSSKVKFVCTDTWTRASCTITVPSWECSKEVESTNNLPTVADSTYGQIVCVKSNEAEPTYYIRNAKSSGTLWSPIEKNTYATGVDYYVETISGVKIQLCGFQCEEGNMATAWHLAPEEEEYLRSLAQLKADTAASKASDAEKAASNSADAAKEAKNNAAQSSISAAAAATRAETAINNATTAINNATAAKTAAETAKANADQMKADYDKAIKNLEVIVGKQTAATNNWIGVVPFAKLYDKQQIVYWLPVNSEKNATLSLYTSYTSNKVNTPVMLEDGKTRAVQIPIYYGGSTRLGTEYVAGNVIRMVYRSNTGITNAQNGWWCDANYNKNDNTYDRILFNQNIQADSEKNISAGSIIVGSINGYTQLIKNMTFDINKPILYAKSAIEKGKVGTNNYLSYPQITMPNTGTTLKEQTTAYICGTLHGSTFKVYDVDGFITSTPSIPDLYYISLGFMSTTNKMYLYPEHPMYILDGSEQKLLNQVAYEAKLNVKDVEELMDPLLINWDREHGDYAGRLQKTPMLPALYPILISGQVQAVAADKINASGNIKAYTKVDQHWCSHRDIVYEGEDLIVSKTASTEIQLDVNIPAGEYIIVGEFNQDDKGTVVRFGSNETYTINATTWYNTITFENDISAFTIIPADTATEELRIKYLIVVPSERVLNSIISVAGKITKFYIDGVERKAMNTATSPNTEIGLNTYSIRSVLGCNYVWGPTISKLKLSGRTNVNDVNEQYKNVAKEIAALNVAQQNLEKTMASTYISQANYNDGMNAIDQKYSKFTQMSDNFTAIIGLKQKILDNEQKVTSIENHLKYDENGLRLYSTGESSGISTIIAKEGMRIEAPGERVVAKFLNEGMEIPKASITTSLSLGTAQGGFYDLIDLNGGIAWKWRDA